MEALQEPITVGQVWTREQGLFGNYRTLRIEIAGHADDRWDIYYLNGRLAGQYDTFTEHDLRMRWTLEK